MQKNEIYTQTITDLGCNGEGIVKVDGITCFIMYFVFKMFILTNDALEKYIIAIIIVGGLFVFVIFDYMMKRFQKLTNQIVERLKF